MPTALFACDSCLARAAVEAAEGMGYLREGDGLYRTAEEAAACEAAHVVEAARQEEERRLAAEQKAAERLAFARDEGEAISAWFASATLAPDWREPDPDPSAASDDDCPKT